MGSMGYDVLLGIVATNVVIVVIMYFITKLAKKKEKENLPEDFLKEKEKIQEEFINPDWAGVFFLTGQALLIPLCLILGYDISIMFYAYTIIPLVCAFLMILFIIMMMLKIKRENRAYRDIAVKTGEEIVVDFKYKAMKLVINWKLELISAALLIYLNIKYLQNDIFIYMFATINLYVFLYLKMGKNRILEMLRHSYRSMARMVVIFQVYKLYMPTIRLRIVETSIPPVYDMVVIGLLTAVIVLTAVTGIKNFKKLDKLFPEKTEEEGEVSAVQA
ncbi:MAG: hypothetical protein GY863_18565 [bacterium]|nr:hypothetical protein [bacterium]